MRSISRPSRVPLVLQPALRSATFMGILVVLAAVVTELILLAFHFGYLYFPVDGQAWNRVTHEAPFSPRDTAEVTAFQGAVWLSNGFNQDVDPVVIRDLWRSRDGCNWELVSSFTPYDAYAEMAVHNKQLFAVKQSVWVTKDGRTWNQLLSQTPFGERPYGELVSWKGFLWQLGSGRDVWRSADGKYWECVLVDAPWGERFGSSVVVWKNRLWLIGGSSDDSSAWWSADGINWQSLPGAAPLHRWSSSVVVNERVHVSVPWSARHEASVWEMSGQLWMLGGNAHPLQNDVWWYDMWAYTQRLTPTSF